jgi:SAM-dependent methyltransferase
MSAPADFYDALAPLYHLIFADWEASVERQGAALDALLRQRWGQGPLAVLDVACGIGTQALGLARRGHRVTGSDISPAAVARARREAAARGLDIPFSVADMREARSRHTGEFDVVIACDNALPHLLGDDELLQALRQMHACARPGGGCLVTVRDYDREERIGVQVKPYGARDEDGARWLIWQVWEFHGDVYDLAMYFTADRGGDLCETRVFRSRYRALGTGELAGLMRRAGFESVERLDGIIHQPVLMGRRAG